MMRWSSLAGPERRLVLGLVAVSLIAGITIGALVGQQATSVGGKAKRVPADESKAPPAVGAEPPSPSLTAAGFDSERVWSAYDDWEPALAADPGSSYVYQLTTRYTGPAPCRRCSGPWIVFRRSGDGGATWEPDRYLTPFRRSHNDPQIEVANDGAVYVAWLNDYMPGVKFIRSTDRGNTWSTPIEFTGRRRKPSWSDKPILAISPDGRDVYIAFNASDSYVVASHDSGATFSKPVRTNNDGRYWFHTGGAVAPNGDAYFAAADYSQDYTGDSHVNVLRSTDGGATWTTTRVDSSKQMPDCAWSDGCYLGFLGPSVALATDKAGTIMIAYNAGDVDGAPHKLYVRTSTDGLTWSLRQEVSNGSTGANNAFPALATGPTPGDFRLAWQDDRNGVTTAWNTWYRRTTNGGATWSAAVRVSDRGSGAAYKNANGYAFPYGDYLKIAVDSAGTTHLVWGEGSSYTGPGGTWYTRGQ
jgi:hypothetical protein